MDRRKIAERLLKAYEESKYSYGDLSKLTGIPRTMIQRYFTGDIERIPIERLEALSRVLGLDINELLGWNQPGNGKIMRSVTPQQSYLLDASETLTEREQEMLLKMIESIKEYRQN